MTSAWIAEALDDAGKWRSYGDFDHMLDACARLNSVRDRHGYAIRIRASETGSTVWSVDPKHSDTMNNVIVEMRKHAPYGEWCRDPNLCVDKGYCPRDPTCGD